MNKEEAKHEAFNLSWPLNKLKSDSNLITHPSSYTSQIPSSSSLRSVMTYVRLYMVVFLQKDFGECHHLFSVIVTIYTQQMSIQSMTDTKLILHFSQVRAQDQLTTPEENYTFSAEEQSFICMC